MSVRWRNYVWSHPRRATADEIAALEREWKVPLPADFLQTISMCQGMSPRPDAFDVGGGENSIAALLIVSPDEQRRAYSIRETYAQVKSHVPDGIYPFAVTGTGDYVCFDYRGSVHSPRVVFYFAEESGEEAIHPIASSFSDLLARLHE